MGASTRRVLGKMQVSQVPIETFIERHFQHPKVAPLISNLDVANTTRLLPIIAKDLKEMGIFFANNKNSDILLETIVTIINTSEDIQKMLRDIAKDLEMTRRRNKHLNSI